MRGGVIECAEAAAVSGIEFTTFSLIGRCERTGMFGIAISTSEMAVGSRCIHVAPGVGAIVTQASTNPRLGHLGLNLLRAGYRRRAFSTRSPPAISSSSAGSSAVWT